MGAFFTAILGKIVSLAAWLGALVVAMFAAIWLLGTDLGCWFVESMLDVVISIMNSIDMDFELFNPGNYISALPPRNG